jgi:hypothetical protein
LDSLKTDFNNTDFATETTLDSLKTDFNNTDFATETTLDSLKTDFNNTDFATETTLDSLKTDFNNTDFATETTLEELNSKIPSGMTVANGRLKVEAEIISSGNTIGAISYSDSPNLDAFARLRTSAPQTIFDSKQIVDKQPLFWDDQLVSGSGGSSTFNNNQASTTLSIAANTACRRVRQTFRWFSYQPGKSQLIVLTGVLGAATTGVIKRMGLFEDNNGLFLEINSSGCAVGVRTKVSGVAVDTLVPQASWNKDKLNGTGVSGKTLDFTKTQLFFIDFGWLGVGRIRYGFFIDGVPYYCVYRLHQ